MTNRADSARLLTRLEHHNAFLVPLDRQRTWYRYHHLFQEMLRAELDRQFPRAARGLLDRAAAWHEHDGAADEAFEYARAIGDFDRAGHVLMRNMEELVSWGHIETARRWLTGAATMTSNRIPSSPLAPHGSSVTRVMLSGPAA